MISSLAYRGTFISLLTLNQEGNIMKTEKIKQDKTHLELIEETLLDNVSGGVLYWVDTPDFTVNGVTFTCGYWVDTEIK